MGESLDFKQQQVFIVSTSTYLSLDEYSMMPHHQGNAKLEYNGDFRAQKVVDSFVVNSTYLIHLRPDCHYTPVGTQWMQKISHSRLFSTKIILFAAASVTRCNGVVRQVAGRLQRVTCSLCNLSTNLFGLATIPQSKLVLYNAIFLATCLPALKKEIRCKLQKSCYTLQSRTVSCNGLETIHAIAAESSST